MSNFEDDEYINDEQRFHKYWHDEDFKTNEQPDSEKLYGKLRNEIFEPAVIKPHRVSTPLKWYLIAAAVVGIILFTAVNFFNNPVQKDKNTENWITKRATTHDELFYLPDSSLVNLKALSKIIYTSQFGISKREIVLHGTADFVTRHDDQQPFTVSAGTLKIIDIGTAFSITMKPYMASDSSISIKVNEGKVIVKKAHSWTDSVQLKKGDSVYYTVGNPLVKIIEQPSQPATKIHRWLDFKNASLQQILDTLSDRYQVKFRLKNSPSSAIAFTGKMEQAELSSVLEAIGFSLHFTFYKNQNEIVINFNNTTQ